MDTDRRQPGGSRWLKGRRARAKGQEEKSSDGEEEVGEEIRQEGFEEVGEKGQEVGEEIRRRGAEKIRQEGSQEVGEESRRQEERAEEGRSRLQACCTRSGSRAGAGTELGNAEPRRAEPSGTKSRPFMGTFR